MAVSARTGRRLFLFSLWYFPSHFGMHVDDVARAFSETGYDVTIVTAARPTFDLPYFDPFRDTFDAEEGDWHDVVRLDVERLEDRGLSNPHIFLSHNAAFAACRRRMEEAPCHLLHYFEMLLPYFNSETVRSARTTSVMYAGDFVSRTATRQPGKAAARSMADRIVREFLDRSVSILASGGYRLCGTDCVFSETRALPNLVRATELHTPAYWTSRPIFAEPVIQAPPCDIHAEFDIPRGAKVLLYAGRPAKNAVVLPAILEFIQRRHANERIFLLLIGTHPEIVAGWPNASALRDAIKASPLVGRAKLFGIMKSATVLVYPGLVDGYPKVISEAGLAHLPVVAFNSPASGLREMMRDGDTALLIDVGSPTETSEAENEQFAAAVDRILSDRPLREALVARAFTAAQRMDARQFVARIERRWRRFCLSGTEKKDYRAVHGEVSPE